MELSKITQFLYAGIFIVANLIFLGIGFFGIFRLLLGLTDNSLNNVVLYLGLLFIGDYTFFNILKLLSNPIPKPNSQ